MLQLYQLYYIRGYHYS